MTRRETHVARLFFLLAAASLFPWVGPAPAPAAGVLFSLLVGNPAPAWNVLVAVARPSLVLTLFLVGTGLTRDVLKRVGLRPLAQGLARWLAVSAAALAAILTGLMPPP